MIPSTVDRVSCLFASPAPLREIKILQLLKTLTVCRREILGLLRLVSRLYFTT